MTSDESNPPNVPLTGGRELRIERGEGQDVLHVLDPLGQSQITIEVTAAGTVVRASGPKLRLESAGELELSAKKLSLDAEQISVRARAGLDLHSESDARLSADGALETSGRSQLHRAELGSVRVQANDDVRLDGERVMVNCEEDRPERPLLDTERRRVAR